MLHHVEINVTDINKTIEFWDWFLSELNYEIFQKWNKGMSWRYQSTYLVFVQADEQFVKDGYHRSKVGLNHLAFHANSRNQVDGITEKLIEKNIPILYHDRHPYAGGRSHYAVFFEDPDRIKVELVAPS
ncbi:VOC family protein [Mesobacillus jeotgali]|uniref:VOC family protein n=1 Tax=Mesobacillus jeotgali TaxID=129985 RepID=UPI0009A79424|nr:VOC family protein [Mesobacillus jeotgali]